MTGTNDRPPSYAYRPLGNPNSDHPACCDMALGERLRKDVYEALRAGKVRRTSCWANFSLL